MTDYNARIEFKTREDVDDRLLDALVDYHAVTSRSERGWVEAIITLPAENLRQATTTALAIAETVNVAPLLAIEVLPTDEFDARYGLARMPELVSVTEAALLLGVSRQAVLQRLERGTLSGSKVGDTWVVQRGQLIPASRA